MIQTRKRNMLGNMQNLLEKIEPLIVLYILLFIFPTVVLASSSRCLAWLYLCVIFLMGTEDVGLEVCINRPGLLFLSPVLCCFDFKA